MLHTERSPELQRYSGAHRKAAPRPLYTQFQTAGRCPQSLSRAVRAAGKFWDTRVAVRGFADSGDTPGKAGRSSGRPNTAFQISGKLEGVERKAQERLAEVLRSAAELVPTRRPTRAVLVLRTAEAAALDVASLHTETAETQEAQEACRS